MLPAPSSFGIEGPPKAHESLGVSMTTREREVGESHPASVGLRRDSNLEDLSIIRIRRRSRKLLFHAEANYAPNRIGEVVQRFFSGVSLRQASRKVKALSYPPAVESVLPDTDRERPRCMIVVALALEAAEDSPEGCAHSLPGCPCRCIHRVPPFTRPQTPLSIDAAGVLLCHKRNTGHRELWLECHVLLPPGWINTGLGPAEHGR